MLTIEIAIVIGIAFVLGGAFLFLLYKLYQVFQDAMNFEKMKRNQDLEETRKNRESAEEAWRKRIYSALKDTYKEHPESGKAIKDLKDKLLSTRRD